MRLQRRRQRRQSVGGARRIAMRIVLAVGPRRFELAAGARALLVQRAAHAATDVAHQADATSRLGLGAAHGDVKRTDLDRRIIRNRSAGRGAFTPEERHTKVRAAGTAREAGIIDGHGGHAQIPDRTGERPFYSSPAPWEEGCGRAPRKISADLPSGLLTSRRE